MIPLTLRNVLLKSALEIVQRSGKIQLTYDPATIPGDRVVSLVRDSVSVREALHELLRGTGLLIEIAPMGNVMLIRPKKSVPSSRADSTARVQIQGRIVDSTTGAGIADVAVAVTGTKLTTVTNMQGEFAFANVSPGEKVITFRLLGYRSTTRAVNLVAGQPVTLRVVLVSSATVLSGVVTTATGVQRKIEVGNDITVIDADSVVRNMPISTLSELLATRVPGMNVMIQSGTPGAPSRMRIRGLSSINSTNDPIVILDGVRMYSAQFGQGQYNTNDRSLNMVRVPGLAPTYAVSPLDQIDPNSIETVEVLKGPSAVALYGTDAANGVILITSKRGKPGPMQWSFNGTWGTETIPGKWPDNYWMWGHNEAFPEIAMQCRLNQTVAVLSRCVPDSLEVYQLLNDPSTTMLGRGSKSSYRADVRGGASAFTYAVSAGVSGTLGLMKMPDVDVAELRERNMEPTEWQRRPQASESQNFQIHVESEMHRRLRVGFTSIANRSYVRSTPLQQGLTLANRLSPPGDQGSSGLGTVPRVGSALLQRILEWRGKVTSLALRTSNALNVSAQPFGDVTATATTGYDLTSRKDLSVLKRGDCATEFGMSCVQFEGGYYNEGKGTATAMSTNVVISSPISFGPVLTVRASAGGNFVRTVTEDVIVNASNIPAGANSWNGAATITPSSRGDDRSTAGVYFETNLSVGKRLFFPLAIRRDAGSGLGDRVRPAFPKLAFSYVMSDEPIFARSRFAEYINTLRVRMAYGQSGVQPAMTTKLRTYVQRTVPVETTPVVVQTIATIGNPELRPEVTTEIEGGADVDLLANRLTLGLTWYRKRTHDALINEPLPPSMGYVAQGTIGYVAPNWQRNIGIVQNNGYDITVRGNVWERKAVQWSANAVLSRTRNVLLKYALADADAAGGGGSWGRVAGAVGGTTTSRFAEGYPLYGIWVFPIMGWADSDENGVITGGEVEIGDSMIYAGAPSPNFQTSLHQTLTVLGRFSISATFDYQNGFTQLLVQQGLSGEGLGRAWNDPSTPLKTQAYLSAALNPGPGRQGSAIAYVQTVSTLRFNALSIGYTLPPELTRKVVRNRAVRLSLQGTNLALWSNYRGMDPNINSQMMMELSRDYGSLPAPRVWQLSLGIN